MASEVISEVILTVSHEIGWAHIRPRAFTIPNCMVVQIKGVGRVDMFDLYSEVCGKAVVGNPRRPS